MKTVFLHSRGRRFFFWGQGGGNVSFSNENYRHRRGEWHIDAVCSSNRGLGLLDFLTCSDGLVSAVGRRPGFSETRGSAPDALGSAVDRRAYFFLFRQEKVAKKKATPAYAVGCADSLALLEGPGGCGTRLGCAKPQTVLADFPRPFSAAQRFRWGPRKTSQFAGSTSKNHSYEFDALTLPSRNSLA